LVLDRQAPAGCCSTPLGAGRLEAPPAADGGIGSPVRWLRGQPLHHARFEVGAAWGWRLQPQAVMDAGEEQHRRARLDGGRDHDKLPHRHGLLIQI